MPAFAWAWEGGKPYAGKRDAAQLAQDRLRLPGRQTSNLRRSRAWRERRIKRIDIETKIRRSAADNLAFVPGDNRYAWLAAAMRARWIVAFDGDRPVTKNWPIDALVPYPRTPGAWGDLVATLAEGPPPRPYARGELSGDPPSSPAPRPSSPTPG